MIRLKLAFVLLILVGPAIANEETASVCYGPTMTAADEEKVSLWLRKNGQSNDPQVRVVMSMCEETLGRMKAALEHIEFAIEAEPDYPLALQSKARILLLMGEESKAEEAIRRSIRTESGDIDDFLLLYEMMVSRKELRALEPILRRKLKDLKAKNPIKVSIAGVRIFYDEVVIYMLLSELLWTTDRREAAVKILFEGIERSTGSREMFDALNFALNESGRIEDVRQAREEYCDNPTISGSIYC